MNEIKKAMNEYPILRWGILLLISIVIFANYYCYDALSSIKTVMQKELNLSSTDYGLIVAFYSLPNLLGMTILGGIILDRWGIRLTGGIFVFFTGFGALITAYGASDFYQQGSFGYSFMESFLVNYSPELKMMMLGRLFFGLGAETSIVVINKILVKWFKGKEIALAFAVNLAIARFGTALALILSPVLIESHAGWSTTIWLAAMLVGISLLFFMIYSVYDMKLDRQIKQPGLLDEEEKFQFSDILKLLTNRSFIFITLLCVTFYSAVFPFLTYAPDLFHNKFGLSLELSGRIASILPFGTIIFTPLFGWFVDKKGKSASLMIYGSILLIIVHLILSLTKLPPYIPIFLLGVAFSLVPAAMWPAVAKIVDERRIGTAYGIMFSVQNLGLFAFPILAGKLLDKINPGITPEIVKSGAASLDYTYTVLMFAGLGVLGLIFAFLLKKEDKTSGYNLELPSCE